MNGRYVRCRVLKGIRGRSEVDVSLRSSRLEGDLDDDDPPEADQIVHAYVIETTRFGVFIRIGRKIEGLVMRPDLSDNSLPDPAASFPPGRLVVGKVKNVRPYTGKKKKGKISLNLDLRESAILESQLLHFSDIQLMSKHRGTVTNVEDYGVFVRLENSNVRGLVHKSECSDNFVKSTFDLYDPGDLVKVLVIKKDDTENKIGLSMKASHFKDDEDSDDDSSSDAMSDNDGDSDADEDMPDVIPSEPDDLDSDDEEFGAKLAAKLGNDDNSKEAVKKSQDDTSSSDSDSNDDSDDDSDDDSKDEEDVGQPKARGVPLTMDTDVGFDWNASSSLLAAKKPIAESESDKDEESDDENEDDSAQGKSHKSRKKQAQKRREEQEIFRRETALADGTADENPETVADFERLISGDPNASEIWIRYMAFHLSLGDVSSARAVAERAFDRIEFRQEREKLNVWCGLLTLELKYGDSASLQKTIDRACQQNNPKHVYLRVCEMIEKEINLSSPDSIIRADEMYNKMCKKFRSKKKVWLAHLQYLLKFNRSKEAQDLLARSLKSLPEYKHVETMSKFAQLEFEYGSSERARTIYDGILAKYPKRLDLVFVYADKEIKHGTVEGARGIFEKISSGSTAVGNTTKKGKLSDKQMKSLFKKWYRLEEEHGTPETQEHVKNAARAYVERSSSADK